MNTNNKKLATAMAVLAAFLFTLPSPAALADQGERSGFRKDMKEKRRAFINEQREENQAFRQTLKDKTPQEKTQAIAAYRTNQNAERMAFLDEMHAKRMAQIDQKLATNTKLTDAQKQEVKSFREQQFQDFKTQRQTQFGENQAVLNELAANPNLTKEEARAKLKEHFQTQKVENKAFRKDERIEKKSFWDSIRSSMAPKSTN